MEGGEGLRPPKFIDGSLSLDYDLQGERLCGLTYSSRGTERVRNRVGGQDAPVESTRGRPRAEAKATCLAIEDRSGSPVYAGERLRGAPSFRPPTVITTWIIAKNLRNIMNCESDGDHDLQALHGQLLISNELECNTQVVLDVS